MVTSHSASLSGLAANTLYHYRVKSRDAAGNLATSGDFTFTTASSSSTIYSYNNPPPLPPSNPATTVNVSNVSQLISAINNLQSGQTIRLAAGTYNLSGVTDALYIPQGISNWTVRGATGNRADVVILGAGMSGSVRFGFWTGNSTGGTIADLTIDGVSDHGIIVNPGAHNLLVHNVRIVDSDDQFVKSNPDANGSRQQQRRRGILGLRIPHDRHRQLHQRRRCARRRRLDRPLQPVQELPQPGRPGTGRPGGPDVERQRRTRSSTGTRSSTWPAASRWG